jgi:glycosyltransferase involved in cell wall biosynthesis
MLAELLAMPPASMARELSRWFGQPTADEVGAEMVADPGNWPWSVENVTRFPLTELALSAALAVVTHSEFAAHDVRERFAGDVYPIPLPALHFADEDVAVADLSGLDERPVILQAGVLNPNKQIYKVVEAFELAGISHQAQLVICGYADDNTLSELQHDVSQRGLRDSVRVLGPVSDATLHALRRRASIATVLRDPCIEAASAVLLDSMAYGLAVLTVNIGHYLEVPSDTVARVGVPVDAAEIAQILRRWIADPAAARRTGMAARSHALDVHTPIRYARSIANVLTEVGAYPRRQALAADLAVTLTRLGFNGGDPITERVAESSTQLFGSRPRLADQLIYNR